jgi:CHAT domain-containing protein
MPGDAWRGLGRHATWRVRSLVTALVLSCLAGHPANPRHDAAALDTQLLAALDRVVAPLPRLRGSSLKALRFWPEPGGGCPSAIALPVSQPQMTADERRHLARLGREVARLASLRPNDPDVLRLQALWALLSPTVERRERVVRLLVAALAREPGSAARRNDLAVARLLQASLDGQSAEFAAALELLDPGVVQLLPEARVNESYALQCLTLWDEATRAWRELPAASAGVARADGGGVAANPLARRRRAEWLLGEWATQRLHSRDAVAVGLLREAEAIGADLAASGGDSLLAESIDVIRRVEAAGDRRRMTALLRGHAAFHGVRGAAIYSECRVDVLRSAERRLMAAGSPFARFVRLDQAICAYFANDFLRAVAMLHELREQAVAHQEISIEGRCEWMLGLVGVVQAKFAEANRHYARAIELYTRLGEGANVAYIHSLRARSNEYGGARREAWNERLAALAARAAIVDPTRLFVIFEEAVTALQGQGYRAAALDFLTAQMHVAASGERLQAGKTDLLVFTLLERAELLAEAGRDAEAARDLDAAQRAWERLSPRNESRDRLRVEIDLRRTLTDRRQGSGPALAAVDRALDFFAPNARSLGGQLQVLKLYRERARIEEKSGDFRAARADLLRGAAEVERQRLDLATIDDRAHFLAQARDIFLALVCLDLDRFAAPAAALEAFERGSNRVLADSADERESSNPRRLVLSPETLRAMVPSGGIVIRFGHLADRLLIWTLFEGRLEFEQRWVPEYELRRQVAQCRDLLIHGETGGERAISCNSLAQELLPHRLLALATGETQRLVVFVPDETLAPLPLGVLRLTPQGPRVLEQFRVCYAPSLALLRGGLGDLGSEVRPPPRSALFVTDPAFSTQLFPTLTRLPAARRAVSRYAARYPRAEVLADRAATVGAVLARLGRFDLLQFDGHGLSNAQYPERGGLLLAQAGPRPLDLAGSVLSAASLPAGVRERLRLVVLGACSTGLSTYRDAAEVTGPAAAFLATGVPEVVATAWDVTDAGAADLLDRFHVELAAGRSSLDALRAAQLGLLRNPGATGTAWAAFQLFVRAKSAGASVQSTRTVGLTSFHAVLPGERSHESLENSLGDRRIALHCSGLSEREPGRRPQGRRR